MQRTTAETKGHSHNISGDTAKNVHDNESFDNRPSFYAAYYIIYVGQWAS